MRPLGGPRALPVLGSLLVFLICVHGRRKYPEKVHQMIQERLARHRYGADVGEWSSWGAWSACSLPCGGGVSTQTRHCTPHPGSLKHHTRKRLKTRLSNTQCVGVYKRFHMCNEQACPEPTDLRAEQCTAFDSKPYMGKLYQWRPHYSKSRPCALSCQPVGYAFYVTLARAVRDGTRCSPDGGPDREDHVCAAGMCKHVGCDGVVGSGRVRDACGECGGNNSTCQIISGLFTEPYMKVGYRQVVQIPAGACSVRIEEMGATKNYLALGDTRGKFIINGNWNIDLSGNYAGAGTTFKYQRQHHKRKVGEIISAKGPTTEPVDIFLLYRQVNRGIKYEYAIKRNSSLTSVLPRLLTGPDAGKVAAMPDSLVPLRRPADPPPAHDAPALPSRGGFVSPLYQSPAAGGTAPFRRPDSAAPFQRPGASVTPGGHKRRRRRRRRRSRFQWVVTGFSECTKTCGGGTKTTEVVCMKRKRKQLAPDRDCKELSRPEPTTLSCNPQPCPAMWQPGAWSACSVSCGSGQQSRPMVCVRDGRMEPPERCPGGQPADQSRPCQQPACGAGGLWRIGRWSPCSVTCGWGQRTREVTCHPAEGLCSDADRPRDTQQCRRRMCRSGSAEDTDTGTDSDDSESESESESLTDSWMVSEWSEQCSVECGQGVQWRQVVCSGSCENQRRPEDTRPCKTDRGCAGVWFTGPWSRCSHACGAGAQTRPVTCVRLDAGRAAVVSESACSAPRPAERQPCSGGACAARWHGSDWGVCSASCGAGRQSRAVACLTAAGAAAQSCPADGRPQDSRACLLADCPRRALFDWASPNGTSTAAQPADSGSPAPPGASGAHSSLAAPPVDGSDRAGGSLEPFRASPTETYDAVVNTIVNDPPSERDNSLEPTGEPWEGAAPPLTPAPAPATEAAASAAPAAVERPAQHRAGHRGRPRKHHKHRQRPAGDQQHSDQSNSLAADCVDRFNNCRLVQQARLCRYKYYKTHCCETCSRV
ncbi:thrombospondin type-1 domain-containing protein 4-like isoform X1 [Amphibalanus amphitrite]|uniref:thrombospondin type-1 domain-containing protein 4-like isoform X1 n=1 Tax=Amphibalanus amphitrite TaxID=1232801 RepID=UPI001C91BE16|nr:thrombospondin type-1 domain-containing protein 4-like isoform X1 [Amphibalanus amphitrite]